MMKRAPTHQSPTSFDDITNGTKDEHEEDEEQPILSQMSLHPMPMKPELPTESHKKVIYFVRHAEATHNVKEREAVRAVIASGDMDKGRQDQARRAVLQEDPSLKDAPLSVDGTEQARMSGKKLKDLFRGSPPSPRHMHRKTASPFRSPDIVLVSPLRRALMTATALFNQSDEQGNDPPLFLAIEALREKRTGLACDERSSVSELEAEFPHVDFSDVKRGLPVVPEGEGNDAVRARAAEFLDTRLEAVPGKHIAVVSHKGWLREQRKVLMKRGESNMIRANFDISEWDTTLYGNAEVRVAAFRWQDSELVSVVSRSLENAILASMCGDGFEFALGPSSGFSIFLADRTTKVHFISLSEGRHNVAIREVADSMASTADSAAQTEALMLRESDKLAWEHPLYDARLTQKGIRQAKKLKQILANRPSGGRPFTAFELVITSPLTRELETAQEIFSDTPGTYGGDVIPPSRVLVSEDVRERYGRYVCDGRRSVSELHQEFQTFDFSLMPSDVDDLHGDERESSVEIEERALRLLGWLSARPERCIAVVTHSEFLRYLFGQFTDTLHEEDRSCLQRTAANCELRSIVLCSHGEVERVDSNAPASTIRVPSCSSLTSLTSL